MYIYIYINKFTPSIVGEHPVTLGQNIGEHFVALTACGGI